MAIDETISAKKPSSKTRTMKRAFASRATPDFIKGRPDFFHYRDLGVADGSNRLMGALITSATQGMSKPTGWHYHLCEAQFVYVLSGWIELEFEDRVVQRVGAGDSVFIPGGMPHNEIRTSDVFELLEVCVPADIGTESCEPPDDRQ